MLLAGDPGKPNVLVRIGFHFNVHLHGRLVKVNAVTLGGLSVNELREILRLYVHLYLLVNYITFRKNEIIFARLETQI